MNTDRERLNQISAKIIGSAHRVNNALSHGFLEKLYENALVHDLRKSVLQVSQQHKIQVRYDGIIVGDYEADWLVEDSVLVEIKAVQELNDVHMAQCLNYLKATGLKLCLLINFGKPKVEIRRIVL